MYKYSDEYLKLYILLSNKVRFCEIAKFGLVGGVMV